MTVLLLWGVSGNFPLFLVGFVLRFGFVLFFLLHRLLSRMFLQQSMTCITPHSSNQISACRSQPTQCPAHSRGLRPSGSRCRTGTSTVSSNIHAPSWDSVFTRQCRWDLPLLFGFGWFYMFSNPSSFFFFPYLIFYIKSWWFLSASVWPPNPINIRIFFPHLQNKQTIRRPAWPQLFLTF